MFWPLARQVTLGKGRPDTPHLMRWLASFIFTICVDIIDVDIVDTHLVVAGEAAGQGGALGHAAAGHRAVFSTIITSLSHLGH